MLNRRKLKFLVIGVLTGIVLWLGIVGGRCLAAYATQQ